ncbi:hypothetical protein G7069_03380 [Lysobacter sp. HDW10]|uniref:hypothetical protein n=1 Tax=Lysobacter sp. HDW10 TaxID=2714936 RepID=UPI00140977B0|nr:hypothetical protein [Lysobacter sp. HDW10]QIK80726.1 hypothetical protein G7069_03380 [Lysobacter sp. HDW10]
MIQLFKSELQRFRLWALALGVVHLTVLALVSRFVDLAQQPIFVYQVFAAVYMAVGALLGLYQMVSYRRANHWLNLLHRPVHRLGIAGALTGAGAVWLVVATLLPIFLLALYQDLATPRVVDLRHWLLGVSASLIALIGYAAGAFAAIGNRRYSFAIFLFPSLLMFAQANGAGMLALQVTILAAIAALIAIVFKPDPTAVPTRPAAALALALPVQVAAYFLLWIVGFGYELSMNVAGTHPLLTAPAGGAIEADRLQGSATEGGRKLLTIGLRGVQSSEAQLWREQIALSDVYLSGPMRTQAFRHSLTNPAPMEFDDVEHGIRWVFSHDRMRFVGYGTGDNRARGTLGVGDSNAAFPAPTRQGGYGFLFNSRAAYQYDATSKHVFERVRLPDGEVMAQSPEPLGDNFMVLSDRAMYVYSGRDIANTLQVLQPTLRIPLGGKIGNLSMVATMELLDGYLISYTYTWGVWSSELQQPFQQIVQVDAQGRAHTIVNKRLNLDLPPLYPNRITWLSPVLRTLCLQAQDLYAPADPLRTQVDALPRLVKIVALVCCVLALVLAWLWTRKKQFTTRERWLWVVTCGVIGLPAFLALWWMFRDRPARTQAHA